MEAMTRMRQEEGLRFLKWTVDYPEQWGIILDLLSEGASTQRVLKALGSIREYEFYFLMPIVLNRGNLDYYTDLALSKLQVERLIRAISLHSLDSVCEDLIQAIEKAATKPDAENLQTRSE